MKIELLKSHPELINEVNSLAYKQWSYMNPNMTESDWLSGLKNRCNGYELPTTVVAIENNILLGSAALIRPCTETLILNF